MQEIFKKLVVFGELMMSLSTKEYARIVQSEEFKVRYTGAEANAGVMAAILGMETFAVSKVPNNEIGDSCVNYLRRFGLDGRYIFRGGNRIGLLFQESGYSQRPSKVIYDREHTSFSQLSVNEVDWEIILKDKDWLHFSGTAPALSSQIKDIMLEGMKVARKNNIIVSMDYNYRKSLWNTMQARKVMKELIHFVDIGIGNEEDCAAMFGIETKRSDILHGSINLSDYEETAKKMIDEFGLKFQAITLRESFSATKNGWSALIHDGSNCYFSKRYEIDVLDRVGSGDSFSGSLIFALSNGFEIQDALDFAVAASCLKHSIPGDFNLVTKQEIERLLSGDASGRVNR